MNRVNALCAMDRVMMESFSQRTTEGLKDYTLFRLALPHFQSFLDINVGKEVEKDRMVIHCAAEAHHSGADLDPDHVNALLEHAREIDQRFVGQAAVFPIDIRIRYQDIEQYRRERIELLLQTSYGIFAQWRIGKPFRRVLDDLFSEAEFRNLLHKILRLYAMETRMLSRSVRIPSMLTLARDSVTQTITNVMEREAKIVAKSLSHTLYRRQ